MSDKEIVADLIQRVPAHVTLHDIAREIEFIAAVRKGVDELKAGESVSIEEVERDLPSWIIGNPVPLSAARSPRNCPLYLRR